MLKLSKLVTQIIIINAKSSKISILVEFAICWVFPDLVMYMYVPTQCERGIVIVTWLNGWAACHTFCPMPYVYHCTCMCAVVHLENSQGGGESEQKKVLGGQSHKCENGSEVSRGGKIHRRGGECAPPPPPPPPPHPRGGRMPLPAPLKWNTGFDNVHVHSSSLMVVSALCD